MQYKIAETFDSIQGEGTWAGTRMFFIRLAGCNVGTYSKSEDESINALRVLNPQYALCKSALSQEFICDTLYKATESADEHELIARSGDAPIILITGGEPFLWDISYIVDEAWRLNKRVHVETSGTLEFNADVDWVTCAPKYGFNSQNIDYISEWKFIVDRSLGTPQEAYLKIQEFLDTYKEYYNMSSKPIYVMPVNGIDGLDKDNFQFAFEIVKEAKSIRWKVGNQMHKAVGMR